MYMYIYYTYILYIYIWERPYYMVKPALIIYNLISPAIRFRI